MVDGIVCPLVPYAVNMFGPSYGSWRPIIRCVDLTSSFLMGIGVFFPLDDKLLWNKACFRNQMLLIPTWILENANDQTTNELIAAILRCVQVRCSRCYRLSGGRCWMEQSLGQKVIAFERFRQMRFWDSLCGLTWIHVATECGCNIKI